MGMERMCRSLLAWVCFACVVAWMGVDSPAVAGDETEVEGVGFAAPRIPEDPVDPPPEFTDPEGAHDPDEGVIFSSLSFYDLKHGLHDEDKQRWRDTDFIHWVVAGATLKAWGQIHDGDSAKTTVASSEAWGSEQIHGRIDTSEGDYGTLRAENGIVFDYSYLISGNRIGEASVHLLGTAHDVKGRPHTFSLSDNRSQSTTETTEKSKGLSVHEDVTVGGEQGGSLTATLSSLTGSTAMKLVGEIVMGAKLDELVAVEVERRLATAGGDSGSSQPLVVEERVSGRTPLERRFEVFSDGSVVLSARAAPAAEDDDEGQDSEVMVLLNRYKITNTLRVWKSSGWDLKSPEDLEPPPAEPAPGPTTPGGGDGGSGGGSGGGASQGGAGDGEADPLDPRYPLFPELGNFRMTRQLPAQDLGGELELSATAGVLDPFGLDGESGALPGALAIRLDRPAPNEISFAIRVEPAGNLFLQSADDLVIEEGERWATLSIHGREPGSALLVLQAVDADGAALGAPIEVPVETASVATRLEPELWATAGDRSWQPGCGVALRGVPGADVGPLRIGRTGFAGYDETATELQVLCEDPDGILESLPQTVLIPAGETSTQLALRLRAAAGSARIRLENGERELVVEVTSAAQGWKAPLPLRIPIGCVAPLTVRLRETESETRLLTLAGCNGGEVCVLESGGLERTVGPGERLGAFALRGQALGETTLTVTSPGLPPLDIPVEVVPRRIAVEGGVLRIRDIEAAAEGVVALVVPDGMTVAALSVPEDSGEWLEVDGVGSDCLVLTFHPSPDQPDELMLPILFEGEPVEAGSLELSVVDTLHGIRDGVVNSFRMALH